MNTPGQVVGNASIERSVLATGEHVNPKPFHIRIGSRLDCMVKPRNERGRIFRIQHSNLPFCICTTAASVPWPHLAISIDKKRDISESALADQKAGLGRGYISQPPPSVMPWLDHGIHAATSPTQSVPKRTTHLSYR
jgi:hypothetical protein